MSAHELVKKMFSSWLIFVIKSARDMHVCGCTVLITGTFSLKRFFLIGMTTSASNPFEKNFEIWVLPHCGLLFLSFYSEMIFFFLQSGTLGGFLQRNFLLALVFVKLISCLTPTPRDPSGTFTPRFWHREYVWLIRYTIHLLNTPGLAALWTSSGTGVMGLMKRYGRRRRSFRTHIQFWK